MVIVSCSDAAVSGVGAASVEDDGFASTVKCGRLLLVVCFEWVCCSCFE